MFEESLRERHKPCIVIKAGADKIFLVKREKKIRSVLRYAPPIRILKLAGVNGKFSDDGRS